MGSQFHTGKAAWWWIEHQYEAGAAGGAGVCVNAESGHVEECEQEQTCGCNQTFTTPCGLKGRGQT